MINRDQPWDERLASGWIDRDCDAWVVQREVVDLPTYVELWLKDAGLHPSTGGGRGVPPTLRHLAVVVRGAGRGGGRLRLDQPAPHRGQRARRVRLEEWPYDVEQPIGPEVAGLLRAHRRAARPRPTTPRRRPAGRARRPPPGDVRRARAPRTPRRSCCASSAGYAAPPGRHGRGGAGRRLRRRPTVAQVLDALAELLEQDPAELRAAYLPVVRDLVTEGFLDARPEAENAFASGRAAVP